MKKSVKKIILIVIVLFAIFLLDSIIALVLDTSPLIKIREYYDGGTLNYKDKGILTDTYCGINGKRDTVIKGFSYSLSYDDDYEIIDMSKENDDLNFVEQLEEIYEDDNYRYYLSCIKSQKCYCI